MDQATYEAMKVVIDNLTLQNKQLRKANTRQKKKIKQLRRVIQKLKEEDKKNRKPHYRNGRKRGNHGRNG